ncbi:MAG: hypothetical protein HY851_05945, partial [candidate division Zixibacteria bacterium]|nr:hypothetical protein [candidate division Zixibacteria bacterium]
VLLTSTLPPNAVFVDSLNGAGSFTFTPDFTQAGPYSITFLAADAVTARRMTKVRAKSVFLFFIFIFSIPYFSKSIFLV